MTSGSRVCSASAAAAGATVRCSGRGASRGGRLPMTGIPGIRDGDLRRGAVAARDYQPASGPQGAVREYSSRRGLLLLAGDHALVALRRGDAVLEEAAAGAGVVGVGAATVLAPALL